MKVLVTGSNGFIGKNLVTQLEAKYNCEVFCYMRESTPDDLRKIISKVDFICHMAGVNRPDDDAEFAKVNTDLTQILCDEVQKTDRHIPIFFSSSVHVDRENPYGDSKLAAEKVLIKYSEQSDVPVYIFRLSHVIGKWCRPNYNSVVATFCHNIARDIPIQVDNPDFKLNLVYIDDLVDTFYSIMDGKQACDTYCEVKPSYPISVGELAIQIRAFKDTRASMITERVGNGLIRILYSTYISYLPKEDFVYGVEKHGDSRGVFVEMLKTKDSGQFSYFTAHPGITRGGHYHHSKTEKFLVIKGDAKFKFRNIMTNELYEVITSGDNPQIVETIPGWVHDITNIGNDEMVVMLWANEIFDQERPDTYTSSLEI